MLNFMEVGLRLTNAHACARVRDRLHWPRDNYFSLYTLFGVLKFTTLQIFVSFMVSDVSCTCKINGVSERSELTPFNLYKCCCKVDSSNDKA